MTATILPPYEHDARKLDYWECRECGGHGKVLDDDGEQMACDGCKGTGDGRDHKDWCDKCGLSGTCPDCNPPERDDR